METQQEQWVAMTHDLVTVLIPLSSVLWDNCSNGLSSWIAALATQLPGVGGLTVLNINKYDVSQLNAKKGLYQVSTSIWVVPVSPLSTPAMKGGSGRGNWWRTESPFPSKLCVTGELVQWAWKLSGSSHLPQLPKADLFQVGSAASEHWSIPSSLLRLQNIHTGWFGRS